MALKLNLHKKLLPAIAALSLCIFVWLMFKANIFIALIAACVGIGANAVLIRLEDRIETEQEINGPGQSGSSPGIPFGNWLGSFYLFAASFLFASGAISPLTPSEGPIRFRFILAFYLLPIILCLLAFKNTNHIILKSLALAISAGILIAGGFIIHMVNF